MDVGASFVAGAQALVGVQAGETAFDDPTDPLTCTDLPVVLAPHETLQGIARVTTGGWVVVDNYSHTSHNNDADLFGA